MSKIIVPMTDLILPIYQNLHRPNFNYSRIYLRGGRYSGKSTEAARYIISAMIADPTKSKSAIAFRRFRQHSSWFRI
nr:MAG TPA: terminase [Caudoviricetes sp.]